MESVPSGVEMGPRRIKSFRKPMNSPSPRNKSGKDSGSWKKILDPQGSFLENWNKIFLLACIIALALDPLFFYIPVVVVNKKELKCLDLDVNLEKIACVLRTFMDAFYIIHIIFQFRTGFIAAPSRVFGRGDLIVDPWAIAKRYLFTYFIIDVLSILPLPQLLILHLIPLLDGHPDTFVMKELLKYIIICQYVPRILRIVPLYIEVTRTSGFLTETAWAGAALNLFLYMLASHVLGAIWYMISVERQERCWGDVARDARKRSYNRSLLYCDYDKNKSSDPPLLSLLNTSCRLTNPDDTTDSKVFDFGIFIDALQSEILETRSFRKKFFYCFWWGLRNLSVGASIYVSKFAANALRSLRQDEAPTPRMPERMPLLPQKPAEPDFGA
ncbi:hypothetical protein SLEP1_g56704 [Rubroshorea leprosula]|uniref:Ion transport domain-containing protein n=1 Tax=Rubroshorea leprosula TaxID=152421 RepID=A0AAV5MJ39_9ROSI|nr:hypothetical protein SLEP1_g56704 [Rubroshorea leprosula]